MITKEQLQEQLEKWRNQSEDIKKKLYLSAIHKNTIDSFAFEGNYVDIVFLEENSNEI